MPQRAEGLNPRAFISALKSGQTSDEVSIRRAVSAVFFSLFNYWALKHYLKGNRGPRPYWGLVLHYRLHGVPLQ